MAFTARTFLLLTIVSSAQANRIHRTTRAQQPLKQATEEVARISRQHAQPWKTLATLLLGANPAAAFSPGMMQPLNQAFGNHGTSAMSKSVPRVFARAANLVMQAEDDMAKQMAESLVGDSPMPNDEEQYKQFCYGLPGSSAPLGEFDPLGFTNGKSKGDVYRLREAEITHGRVGMLAAAGFLVQENFRPLFDGAKGPAINQIPQLPPAVWFGMTLGIGICESLRIQKGWADPNENKDNFQKLKPDYYPGDLGFDPLGLKPKNKNDLRDMQTRELNNGRLGMLAAAGFMAQEAVTGTTWGPNLDCSTTALPSAPWCPH